MTARHARIDTQLGELTLVAEDRALSGVYFPQHWYLPPADSIGDFVPANQDAVFSWAATELESYLAGDLGDFTVPIHTAGDEFQERVWAMLQQIPYGATTTYGALATELGNPALAQRVGQAVGHNPISIVIPCHRVVGSDGRLTGYAGGLARKAFLLDLEVPAEVAAGRLF
jgi:methylated-DNA-[protein]-cysteine S-methyltransferase